MNAKLGLVAAWALTAGGLVGCASQSGYSLDIRNGTAEVVKVDITSQTKDGEPKLVESMRVTPGHNGTVFTKADAKAIVQMAARIDGDTVSDPALKRLTIGKTELGIYTNPAKDQPPKAPKLVIRERND
jgi:hypothetical protein